jgi:nucleotide-binding universal stress UspA family protein
MIVVGIDGSTESKQALAWALDEARLRQSKVRAIYAWLPPTSFAWYVPAKVLDPRVLEGKAMELVEAAVAEVTDERSDVKVECAALPGEPAAALLDAAGDAELLVVGSRGHGGFAGLLLGSVSAQCSQHATCPVAIVRSG